MAEIKQEQGLGLICEEKLEKIIVILNKIESKINENINIKSIESEISNISATVLAIKDGSTSKCSLNIKAENAIAAFQKIKKSL